MSKKAEIQKLIASSAATSETAAERAPSRLKSRIYSHLVQDQTGSGPLLSLSETKASGMGLCVFEELVRLAPVGERAKTKNCCRVCHARVLAERIEGAPIYWSNCPYVQFQNR